MPWKNLITALYLMVIGVGVVFMSLVLLMMFINAVGWIERLLERFRNPLPVPVVQEGISPEEVVVITAAVTEALAAKVEIQSIRLSHDDDQDAWSRMGRMEIMRSHNLQTPKQ
jgi:Na+-transporting methylmalonyl-CoA/oxaloacetate decarboxylase gamma subunit